MRFQRGSSMNRKEALQLIGSDIERYGHHVYIVSNGPVPRFAYTVGLRNSTGFELILAGAIVYFKDEVMEIINDIASKLKSGSRTTSKFECGTNGSFVLSMAHPTWTSKLILGAFDYFQTKDISVFQIMPDPDHWTIDIPDMSIPWGSNSAFAWRWLYEPWTFPIPSSSVVVTNLEALKGRRVTEAVRWEADQWEAFAGSAPENEDDARVVPIGTLIGGDESVSQLTKLAVGEGIWRDSNSDWQVWEDSASDENGGE